MMMKQIPTHDLSRIGLDIVNDIFASEVKTQYGDSLRIRKNSSFSYDIPTTLWKDFVSGDGGNIYHLYAKNKNLTLSESYRELGEKYGTDEPIKVEHSVPSYQKKPEYNQASIDKAQDIWTKAEPIIGTVAETYLNKRGITYIPNTFKFWNNRLVVPIHTVRNNELFQIGIQTTQLDDEGNKAKVDVVKRIYGHSRGGSVHLTDYSELSDTIVFVEGVEDGLSLVQNNEGISCWAYLGSTNLKNIDLPPYISEIILARDNDTASETATTEFYNKYKDNYSICFVNPTEGYKDFNEMLMEVSNGR